MAYTPMVVGWRNHQGGVISNTRIASGYSLPAPVPESKYSISLMNNVQVNGPSGGVSFVFSLPYANVQSLLQQPPDGASQASFIFAFSDAPPFNPDDPNSGFSRHTGRGSFQLVVPQAVVLPPTTTTSTTTSSSTSSTTATTTTKQRVRTSNGMPLIPKVNNTILTSSSATSATTPSSSSTTSSTTSPTSSTTTSTTTTTQQPALMTTAPLSSATPSFSTNATNPFAFSSVTVHSPQTKYCYDSTGTFCATISLGGIPTEEISYTFTVQTSYVGWVGIGIGSSMTSARLIVGWRNSSAQSVITEREPANYVQPLVTANPIIVAQNPGANLEPKGNAKRAETAQTTFTFSVASDACSEGSQPFIFAAATGAPYNIDDPRSSFPQHDVTGSFSFPVTNLVKMAMSGNYTPATIATTPQPDKTLLTIHGILMFIGWTLCPAIAVFVARYLKDELGHNWYRIHVGLMSAGVSLCMILGLLFVELYITQLGVPRFSGNSAHGVVGMVVVFGLFPVQVALGYTANALFDPARETIPWWDRMHWYVGRMAILAGNANVVLGMLLFGEKVSDAVVVIYLVLIIIIAGVFVLAEVKVGAKHHVAGIDAVAPSSAATLLATSASSVKQKKVDGQSSTNVLNE
ncbi:hypothetical protein BC830DRAFT_721859 [Chytriomyces sp. MP71]|nr:hypothetical protein BC830DRAFT_721859 [Chytriomyces sp. MP71]